ncbi:NAD-dependent epimerase/dehydratase family protein [Limnofasciculus baicalensis]|uniref:NAD-dependent epimerase/dehydratase family protein n=1 Tax=Limnofasciculus baicalensis BBK-W-15 TaxID=2699891 RepID=A0AAE3KLH1_9CYAN|nr:NAD-dependent epimerase/dehydratase family protein [Limnofasciculus baicalensis]MCP2727696.1 NAD-dependent epimerase/dehydratase family protein [Limnofasciculus baicalensis BBK-W-15]
MHFVVTGGAGFIGSHLTEKLLSEGYRVTVVDNLSTGCLSNLPNHPQLKLLQKDILTCQPDDFSEPIDGIAHLAATPSVTASWLEPLAAHDNNLSATVRVIELCQMLKIPKLVFASSAAVYGNQTQLPIVESLPTHPISPYGLQKLVSEEYASLFCQKLGLSFIGLRFFNVYGPRQMPDSPYSGVISIFVKAMKEGFPITIYGNGAQTRDFIYVKDVAMALTKALIAPREPGSSLICNLGTGKTTSLLQLVDILKTCFPEWKSDINFAAERIGDIRDSQADISKVSSILGFAPQSSIAAGMAGLVESLVIEM